MIGALEISTEGFHSYKNAVRDALDGRASRGVIVETYSVTNLAVTDAARRYSPAEVVAVSREVESGFPAHISISYVERQDLTLRMTQKRFARLTNGFSKKLTTHAAAVSLYATITISAAFMRPCGPPRGVALGLADRVRTIKNLLDATLALEPNPPVRIKRQFIVIDGRRPDQQSMLVTRGPDSAKISQI